jgi:DNA repair protein RadD
MNTDKLVGDIPTHWHRLAERRPTVIFAVSIEHSVHIRNEFRRYGVLAEHIDGSTPKDERDRILAQLAARFIEIVTNYQVFTEGLDCPPVSCIVLARPTQSLGLYRQMVGRVLRPAPGKTNALILDHSGAVFQQGFVDDEITWALHEDEKAENKTHSARGTYDAPALTTCPECDAVRFQGQPCTVCGWHPVAKPKRVEILDGELGAVDRDRSVTTPIYGPDQRLTFYRQLLWVVNERGYQQGWVLHKYREKLGLGRLSGPPTQCRRPMLCAPGLGRARSPTQSRCRRGRLNDRRHGRARPGSMEGNPAEVRDRNAVPRQSAWPLSALRRLEPIPLRR